MKSSRCVAAKRMRREEIFIQKLNLYGYYRLPTIWVFVCGFVFLVSFLSFVFRLCL